MAFSFATETGGPAGGSLLDHLHQRGDPPDHQGEHPPIAPVWGKDRRAGAALLPFHRGQGGAISREGPPPGLRGAGGPLHRRGVPQRGLLLAARRRAGRFPPHASPGWRTSQIVRPGYAVEYDYLQPTQLFPSLMTKAVDGLFVAGQTNGTSGYEEAAAQGLMAGHQRRPAPPGHGSPWCSPAPRPTSA